MTSFFFGVVADIVCDCVCADCIGGIIALQAQYFYRQLRMYGKQKNNSGFLRGETNEVYIYIMNIYI